MRSHSTLTAALIIALVALTAPIFLGISIGVGHTGVVTIVAVLAFAVTTGSRRYFHRP